MAKAGPLTGERSCEAPPVARSNRWIGNEVVGTAVGRFPAAGRHFRQPFLPAAAPSPSRASQTTDSQET